MSTLQSTLCGGGAWCCSRTLSLQTTTHGGVWEIEVPPPPSAVGTCRFQDMWLDVLVWLLAHSLGGLGWLGPLRCRGGGGLLSVVGRLEPWDPGRAPDIFILYPTDHVISESVCNTEQI